VSLQFVDKVFVQKNAMFFALPFAMFSGGISSLSYYQGGEFSTTAKRQASSTQCLFFAL